MLVTFRSLHEIPTCKFRIHIIHFLSDDCISQQSNPVRRVITNTIRVYVFMQCQWWSSSAFLCFNAKNLWKTSLLFSDSTISEACSTHLFTPFQFIKHQNSYIVQPNNEQWTKRKLLSLHTSTHVMTLWIELSLECTPHQNADPHCKNYILVPQLMVCNVIRKCVMYIGKKMWNECTNH